MIIATSVSLKCASQQGFSLKTPVMSYSKNFTLLPQNFYNQHLGFFCKKEYQLQEKLGTKIFIRLGSKQYVDYLESKPNTRKVD